MYIMYISKPKLNLNFHFKDTYLFFISFFLSVMLGADMVLMVLVTLARKLHMILSLGVVSVSVLLNFPVERFIMVTMTMISMTIGFNTILIVVVRFVIVVIMVPVAMVLVSISMITHHLGCHCHQEHHQHHTQSHLQQT